MLERYLIEHCAPTLASIKTASLFTVSISSETQLMSEIDDFNIGLGEKGLSLTVLRCRRDTALVYLYRRSHLQSDLKRAEVCRFLSQYGYISFDTEGALEHLADRLAGSDGFPHEIGVFLGYPLEDVVGFIVNRGRNCKHTGCWKVYTNEQETIKLFERFKRCKELYRQLWQQGRTITQLAVAA